MGPADCRFFVPYSTDSYVKGSALRDSCRNGPQNAAEKLFYGINRHLLAVAAGLEGHHSINLGEERVVVAPTDVPARVKLGSALPNDDAASPNLLSTISLHAEKLRVAVPPVSARSYAFFMCHRYPQ